jgi:hypothetical protein
VEGCQWGYCEVVVLAGYGGQSGGEEYAVGRAGGGGVTGFVGWEYAFCGWEGEGGWV